MRFHHTLAVIVLFTFIFTIAQGAVGFSDDSLDLDALPSKYDFVEYSYFGNNDNEVLAGHMRMENTGTLVIDTSTEMHSTQTINVESFFNMSFNDGPIKSTINMSSQGVLYVDEITGNVVKSTANMNQVYAGAQGSGSLEVRTITELLNYTNTWPGPNDPAIGDKWTIEIEEGTNSIHYENGQKIDTEEDSETRITYYEYIRDEEKNTVLGSNNCRVYKTYTTKSEANTHYTLDYIPKGKVLPVYSEEFEDGKKVYRMELIAKRIDGKEEGYPVIGWIYDEPPEKEKDDGMFDLGTFQGIDLFYIIIILSIVLLAIIIFIIILLIIQFANIAKRKKYDPNTQYTCQTCQNDLEYDKGMHEWYCGYCGEYTKQPGPKKIQSGEKYPGVKTGGVDEFYDEEDRKAKLEEQNEYFEYDEDDETETHYVEVPEDEPRPRREDRRRRPPEDDRRRGDRRRRPPEEDSRRGDRRRRPPEDEPRPRREGRRRRPPEDRRRGGDGRRRRLDTAEFDDYEEEPRRRPTRGGRGRRRESGIDWD